ncbi:hypothetical protein [uncultured Shewanella sp.]|uniref:hypothetical protein n=1 Tax=uncultured Shewanella sp. TaxID=173975 RepID=UPI0026082861|nr:hypothetical protein [uncultured Shewanella sp.]
MEMLFKGTKAVSALTKTALACTTLCTVLLTSPVANALDVVIIIDTTGSTGALLPNWQARMQEEVIDQFRLADPHTRFSLASHLDFPFSPYGGTDEYAYRLDAQLDSNTEPFILALNNLDSGWGGDGPESQLEALYQVTTGHGRDLNNNGSFLDQGDISPTNTGFNDNSPSIVIHFTTPAVFHNEPFEPNYPYSGVINPPADFDSALTAMISKNVIYYQVEPNALPSIMGSEKTIMDHQMQQPLSVSLQQAKMAVAATPGERLAEATGGDVLHVGSDLSGLAEAIEDIVEDVRPCPAGQVPVYLPWATYCVPDHGDKE